MLADPSRFSPYHLLAHRGARPSGRASVHIYIRALPRRILRNESRLAGSFREGEEQPFHQSHKVLSRIRRPATTVRLSREKFGTAHPRPGNASANRYSATSASARIRTEDRRRGILTISIGENLLIRGVAAPNLAERTAQS